TFDLFFSHITLPPTFPLFPYTTLFRSRHPFFPFQIQLFYFLGFRTTADGFYNAIFTTAFINDLNTNNPARIFLLSYKHRSNIARSEEHTSELQSRFDLVCRLLLEKNND